ncbi:hypothetical protein [Erythrobacter sp. BLCC-B19]|uniref:hypothetical protein n=1 Tax=Erythrobacter sp. BLCC-B19 TaxID=3025315 RepID=UPI00235DD167|nr:hypothetical protein [Erythrobacter sp. BLCC-B19]WDA41130.1 hypothetical protein PS060_16515 [Erythrobacter sp. BLCC-B19]
MLTESLRDPFAHILGDFAAIEVKSAPLLGLTRFQRPRRTLADRVRSGLLEITAGAGTVLGHEEKAWASITFSGTRHEVVLEFCGAEAVAAGEELIERLPDHEFTLPGQLVADATITKVDHRFGAMERLEVTAVLLLLEEG